MKMLRKQTALLVTKQGERLLATNNYLETQITNFIAGVCSGLSHYLGLEVIWVRLFWIFLSFVTTGFGVIAYLLFWILVPGAETTSEKLKMTGEPINISNIEKKFNEGYQKVSQNIKNVDYDKYEEKIKKRLCHFFLIPLVLFLSTVFKIGIKFFWTINSNSRAIRAYFDTYWHDSLWHIWYLRYGCYGHGYLPIN